MADDMVTLVYAGERLGKGNKRVFLWFEQDNSAPDLIGAQHVYGGRKNIATGRPGMVYTFDASEDGVYVNTARYEGQWGDAEQITQWQAHHDAARQLIAAARKRDKDGRRNMVRKALQPIGVAYSEMSRAERRQLLAIVIEEITAFGGV